MIAVILKSKGVRIMTSREYIIRQLDTLPEPALDKVQEFISFQRYSLGILENDTDYLNSIPGMAESIRQGIETPLSECKDVSEVWPDV
jgi:hypothetical protein